MENPKKFTLQKNVPVKISEIKAGSAGNAKDEFVELYNPNEYHINIAGSGLALQGFSLGGGAANFALTSVPGKVYIAPFSYFLLTSATNYSGSVSADATFNNLATDVLVANGGLALATSTTSPTPQHQSGYAWHASRQLIAKAVILELIAPPLWPKTVHLERIAQGYPSATSTLALSFRRAHQMMGNGVDETTTRLNS